MKIIACFKPAPETQDIQALPDRTLSFDRAVWKIGTYDLHAIEAARQLADACSGSVVGLSAAGQALANAKLQKDALSRGLDELFMLIDDGYADLDANQTAGLLAHGVNHIGGVDLVLVGPGSADLYEQQVGNHLGAKLGWTVLNAVSALRLEDGRLIAERTLEDTVQVVEVSTPAVLSVTSGINTPRIAGMKDVLAASKKPTTVLAADGSLPAPSARIVSVLAPTQAERGAKMIDGDPVQAAAILAEHLRAL